MIIPNRNPAWKEYAPKVREPRDEVREPFLEVYRRALYDVREKAKQMMFSKSKDERKEGVRLHSVVSEFIRYLESNPEEVEEILKTKGMAGRQFPTKIKRTLEERVTKEAYFTRDGETILKRVIYDIKNW